MPSFGISTNWGETRPDGYVQEISREITAETASIKGLTGETVVATNKPRTVTTITAKSKGNPDLSLIARGDKGVGYFYVTGAKYSESNDDFGTAETTVTMYE
jgi:hypothetical protein